MFPVVFASVWKQISYNFILLAALQSGLPLAGGKRRVIDGAGPIRRFFRLSYRLLRRSLLPAGGQPGVCLFDTFPVIDAAIAGGPAYSFSPRR